MGPGSAGPGEVRLLCILHLDFLQESFSGLLRGVEIEKRAQTSEYGTIISTHHGAKAIPNVLLRILLDISLQAFILNGTV